MTVSSTDNTISHDGDGVTVNFPTRQFLANDDIKATLRSSTGVETLWIEGSDYTLVGAGDPNGGTLTATVAPVTGETLVIKTDPSPTQETQYPEGGPFPAKAHETALDKGALVDQNILEQLSRAITVPVTDTATVLELPIDTDRAGKVIVFDELGNVQATAAIDLISNSIGFTASSGPITVTIDATLRGFHIFLAPTNGKITVSFADRAIVGGSSGEYCSMTISDQSNEVEFTAAVAGQLRSQPGTVGWLATLDPVYGGQSLNTSDEAYFRVIVSTNIWRINGPVRAASTNNEEILTQLSGGGGGGGSSTFDGLTDTPANKTGSGGAFLRVNTGESDVEYVGGVTGAGLTAITSADIDPANDLLIVWDNSALEFKVMDIDDMFNGISPFAKTIANYLIENNDDAGTSISVTGASFIELSGGDRRLTSTASKTVTLEDDMPVGWSLSYFNFGDGTTAGDATVAQGTGVLIKGDTTIAQNQVGYIKRYPDDGGGNAIYVVTAGP